MLGLRLQGAMRPKGATQLWIQSELELKEKTQNSN